MTKILEFSDWDLKQYGRFATGSSELTLQKLQERMDDVGGEVETPQECHIKVLESKTVQDKHARVRSVWGLGLRYVPRILHFRDFCRGLLLRLGVRD